MLDHGLCSQQLAAADAAAHIPGLHAQARRFGKPGGVRACAAFGGLTKHDQFKELKAGCEVCVHVACSLIAALAI